MIWLSFTIAQTWVWVPVVYVSLYYPEAFAHGSGRPERTVDDRLVRLLRESDVGFVNSPQLDHHLDCEAGSFLLQLLHEYRDLVHGRNCNPRDRDIPLQSVVTVMDVSKRLQVAKLGIAVQQPKP